jgi:KaiC/GvpD/RAD55 family RecA-like ATPase
MRERHVLSSAIKDRQAFNAIVDHVERDDFSEQGWVVWGGVSDYYDADAGAVCVDADILGDSVARTIMADKHKDMFRNLISGLAEQDTSPANVVRDYLATKRELVGQRLAAAILAGEGTDTLLDEYTDLLVRNEFDQEEAEEARRGYSVQELCAEGFDPANLIRVSPESLNERLGGGVKPGHHLILFARPEMGKTMMTIEMMAGFARQGLTVLYIGNEDPIDDINMRIVNRLSGMTKEKVMADPESADTTVREHGYENIILKALAPGSPREITSLVEEYQPDVLVLDQLRNLNMGQENYVLKLEEAATAARTWAKRYSCVVVSVTQAGDSASGKAVLDLGDVDYSNTGIPAQADVMIGLGASEAQRNAGELMISLPKNKVSGCHEWFACTTEPQLSKIMPLG